MKTYLLLKDGNYMANTVLYIVGRMQDGYLVSRLDEGYYSQPDLMFRVKDDDVEIVDTNRTIVEAKLKLLKENNHG
jgi:hypothetical protein